VSSLASTSARLAIVALAIAARAASAEAGVALFGSVAADIAAWEDAGSAFFPEGWADPRSASAYLDARAEAGSSDGSRCAIEGRVAVDAASGKASYALRELWAEWRPSDFLMLRLGRQRIGFGSGFAWNPSNDLDPRRDAADPSAPRQGIDSACLRIEAGGGLGFPLSLAAVAVMPGAGLDLKDARAGAQLYSCLGPVELMAVASASSLGSLGERWLLGGWGTVGIGPLVLGLEGAWRRLPARLSPGSGGGPVAEAGEYAAVTATATLRSGDFAAVLEASWDQASLSRDEYRAALASHDAAGWAAALLPPGSAGPFHGLARLSWASGDLSAALGGIIDLGSGAFLAQAELAASTGGNATARLSLCAPGSLLGGGELDEDELGLSGRGLGAKASLSIYF